MSWKGSFYVDWKAEGSQRDVSKQHADVQYCYLIYRLFTQPLCMLTAVNTAIDNNTTLDFLEDTTH
jgi:hypothetical protein